jgi:hypothetical protein
VGYEANGADDPCCAMNRSDVQEAAAITALVGVGLVQMALSPRRTLRVLCGGSWFVRRGNGFH